MPAAIVLSGLPTREADSLIGAGTTRLNLVQSYDGARQPGVAGGPANGVVRLVTVTVPAAAGGLLSIYDGATVAGGTLLLTMSLVNPGTFILNLPFKNGLSFAVTVAAGDAVICFQ